MGSLPLPALPRHCSNVPKIAHYLKAKIHISKIGINTLLNSFMTEVPILQEPVHLFALKFSGLVSVS